MPSFLAKIGFSARASFLYSQCWNNTASSPSSLVRVFHSTQLRCEDAAARDARDRANARASERYANNPEYRQRRKEYYAKSTATRRPDHVQKYLNDPEYREILIAQGRFRNRGTDLEAKRRKNANWYKENRNNTQQKKALCS